MAYVINDSCVACGTCIDECPVGAISEGDILLYSLPLELRTDSGDGPDVVRISDSHGRIITTLKKRKARFVIVALWFFFGIYSMCRPITS